MTKTLSVGREGEERGGGRFSPSDVRSAQRNELSVRRHRVAELSAVLLRRDDGIDEADDCDDEGGRELVKRDQSIVEVVTKLTGSDVLCERRIVQYPC